MLSWGRMRRFREEPVAPGRTRGQRGGRGVRGGAWQNPPRQAWRERQCGSIRLSPGGQASGPSRDRKQTHRVWDFMQEEGGW